MGKSFAEKYWKDFEILALQFIQEQYKDPLAKCIHTAFIKDGGYDGSISIDLTKDDSLLYHQILNLIEAKLRTSSNVNIHDFAASIIAAYNSAANTLYIVSNKVFTPETYTITQTFSKKVNLSIILIDGQNLLGWIKKRKHTFKNITFYEQLVKSIQNIDFKTKNITENSVLEQNVSSLLTFSNIIEQDVIAPKLFGARAKQAKETIFTLLCNTESECRYFVLHGAIGCGKSTIISHLEKELQEKDFLFNVIGGESYEIKSIRTLFLCILKSIWAIDPTKIFNIDNISEFISLICSSCGIDDDSGIKKTIREIFDQSHEQIMVKSDLYTAYLLRYLELILCKHKGRNRTIIAFKNLHYMNSEVLDFLFPLIKCLIKNKIGIIVELDSLETLNYSKRYWEKYYRAILHDGNKQLIYEISDFCKEEAYCYLNENLPGLGDKYYDYMISHIGVKPVFLKYAIEWLLLNKIVECTEDQTYYSVAKPEEFFNGITPNQNIKIIENIIRYYQYIHDNNEKYRRIFEATIIMEGTLERNFLLTLCTSQSLEEIIQNLLNSGLYTQIQNGIKIAHHIIMLALENMSLLSYKHSVADDLLTYINSQKNALLYQYKKIDLLEILQEWDFVYELSYKMGNQLYNEGEYNTCIKYLIKCQTSYSYINTQNHLEFLDILYKLLFSYHKIGLGAQQKQLHNLYQFNLQVVKRENKKDIDRSYILMDKMYCARLADPNEQYNLAKNMLKYAKDEFQYITKDLYVEVCFVYALIIKKYKSLDNAVEFLKVEKKKLPSSIKLDIEYQSHEAAKYLNSNPRKALEYYQNIIKYSGVSKYYTNSIGHAYVDILTCYLLLEDWKAFEEIYPKVLEYVQTNNQFTEEGRIYNLDGLYYWIKGDMQLAEFSFRDAQFYLGLVHNQNLSTLVKINFVGFLIAYNKRNEAILECKIAYDLMKKNYKVIFKQIDITRNYRRHREYTGLLALAQYSKILHLFDLNQTMKKEIPIKGFKEHAILFEKKIYPKEVFGETYILHADIICLTK